MNIPSSTYRLQMNRSFTFAQAAEIVPYLTRLGVHAVYFSPVFKARAGSAHGYDITDHGTINPELGTEAGAEALSACLKKEGMLWMQDIVPNHMAFDGNNALIMDVLEKGPSSRYIDYFDIDLGHPYPGMNGRILAPFLGKFYGEALESGEIRLTIVRDGFRVCYYDLSFPLRIESYTRILSFQLARLRREIGAGHPDYIHFLGLLYTLNSLSKSEDTESIEQQTSDIKSQLWEFYETNAVIRAFIDMSIADLNGKPGAPESFNMLDHILSEQWFRLSYWKVASEELNYRRFFIINELISVRAENDTVFETTHSLLLRLINKGLVDAVRVDHIDGLYDPLKYLNKLRNRTGSLYISVEKIFCGSEMLPESWPVQGTTGYDFLNAANKLFILPYHESRFNRAYDRFIGHTARYGNIVFDKKRLIIGKYMAGDVDNLAQLMKSILNGDRKGSDLTLYGLRRALVDVLALFPVYRTYINPDVYSDSDRETIENVIARALEINPGMMNELEYIRQFLLLDENVYAHGSDRALRLHFIMRFQQLTGPLMAKGFEDTVFYEYNRFISLNEVGGDPSQFTTTPEEFHAFIGQRARCWPHSMNTSATHDTKRGEDARARLNVLSEFADEWRRNVRSWARRNTDARTTVNGSEAPARNDEYFFYQTLVGSIPFYKHEFPGFIERVKEYMIKAVREAKVFTAWLKPDSAYENAFLSFIDRVLRGGEGNIFLQEFFTFQQTISFYGVFNSLAQTLIKIAAPGVPDIYQGTELWDFSMVDPDNRREVDFKQRSAYLDGIAACLPNDIPSFLRELFESIEDGRMKMFLIFRGLAARRKYYGLFTEGSYLPLAADGKLAGSVLGFARRYGSLWAVAVVPRFLANVVRPGTPPLGETVWNSTSLLMPAGAPTHWTDAISGQPVEGASKIPIGKIFTHFPAALLIGEDQLNT